MSNTIQIRSKKACMKILDYLQSKEDESKKQRVWAHDEFDSNQTNFEMLSNARAIGLVSSLKGKYLGVLMRIFQAMFDRNFYFFEVLVETDEFMSLTGRQLFCLFHQHPEVNIVDSSSNTKNVDVCVEYNIATMIRMLRTD